MEDWKKKYLRLILNLTIPIVEILAVCLLGPRLLKFFLPFVIGWIIALIANPLVKFLERRVRLVRPSQFRVDCDSRTCADYRAWIWDYFLACDAGD